MGLQYFTLVHILISLAGMAAGFGVLSGLLAGRHFPRWAGWFLGLTGLTSVTGFFFPFNGFTPALATGVVSMVTLGVAAWALYGKVLAGGWRVAYVSGAVMSLYLNVFVLIVQMFQKFPALREAAPTQASPVFGVTQGAVLAVFVGLGVAAAKRFGKGREAAGAAVARVEEVGV